MKSKTTKSISMILAYEITLKSLESNRFYTKKIIRNREHTENWDINERN